MEFSKSTKLEKFNGFNSSLMQRKVFKYLHIDFYTGIQTSTNVLTHYAIIYAVIQFDLFPPGIVSHASYMVKNSSKITNFLKITKQYVLNNWFRVTIIRFNFI